MHNPPDGIAVWGVWGCGLQTTGQMLVHLLSDMQFHRVTELVDYRRFLLRRMHSAPSLGDVRLQLRTGNRIIGFDGVTRVNGAAILYGLDQLLEALEPGALAERLVSRLDSKKFPIVVGLRTAQQCRPFVARNFALIERRACSYGSARGMTPGEPWVIPWCDTLKDLQKHLARTLGQLGLCDALLSRRMSCKPVW